MRVVLAKAVNRNNEFTEYLPINYFFLFYHRNRNYRDKFNADDQKKKNNRVVRHFSTLLNGLNVIRHMMRLQMVLQQQYSII